MTVEEALRQINKLCAIESDGARLIYFQHILKQAIAAERDRCMKLAEECGAFGIADRIRIQGSGSVSISWGLTTKAKLCGGDPQ